VNRNFTICGPKVFCVGIKNYGCLKFLRVVWVGRACAEANEVELTKVPKSGGRRRKKMEEVGRKKREAGTI
jgi:hypothetical protein